MHQLFLSVAIVAGLLCVPGAITAQTKSHEDANSTRSSSSSQSPDKLPDGIQRFNGMLVGRLVAKDIERGTFLVEVDRVPRVWRNSKAENPKSVLGKRVEIDGVSGKWLDVLLVANLGDTMQFEARHDGGNRLTFPGEFLRKVAPVKPEDFPELPEAFRGFHGVLAGQIIRKDAESLELTIVVKEIKDTWKKNQAKDPTSIVGKRVMLAGFWQRRDDYDAMQIGDSIETGLEHIQIRSDHVTVAEFIRKID